MKEIGITEVRKILENVVNDYQFYDLAKMSDEQLMDTDLRYDFGFDSLDFEDMFEELYNLYDITVDIHNPLAEYPFKEEETVKNFIETVNYCLSSDV